MTAGERKALEALKQHERVSYDVSAAARSLGISTAAFTDYLKKLGRKGYILYEPRGRGRNPIIEVLK